MHDFFTVELENIQKKFLFQIRGAEKVVKKMTKAKKLEKLTSLRRNLGTGMVIRRKEVRESTKRRYVKGKPVINEKNVLLSQKPI